MIIIRSQRDRILEPLQSVIGIVERRHTLPILSNVLIETEGTNLYMTATDLEVQVKTKSTLTEQVTEKSSLTLSARKLYDILKSFPVESVITFEAKDNRLTVRSGKGRFSLQTLPGGDFPQVSVVNEPGKVITLSQKLLKGLLEKVQFAMAMQDVRYYLNGTLISVNDNQLTVVATDGHRLSYATEKISESHDKIELILPRKTVSELIKLLSTTDDLVKMTLRENQVVFEFADIELVSKVIDGKFPDYTRVIPVNYAKHISLDRIDLLQSLQRASILSNEKIRGVRLLLSKNCLAIVCTNNEQEEAQEEIDIDYQQEALDIGFNISYLLDVLNHLNHDKVTCSFGDANSSMLITDPSQGDQFKYVVMPMRI